MIYFVYIILCLIWGSTWLAIKIGLDDAPPFWSAGIRFLIASLILAVYSKARKYRFPSSLKEFVKVAVPGALSYAFSYMAVYYAEVYIDSALAGVLFAGFPFFIAFYTMLLIKEEKLHALGWLGLLIGFAGIVVVFYDSLQESVFQWTGVLLVVAAAAASAYGTVYIKLYLAEYQITAMSAVQMLAGALIMLLSALIFESLYDFSLTAKSVFSILFLALFGTVVAFWGYYWLLRRIKIMILSQIAFITPLIAIILGVLIRSESFSGFDIIGSAMILTGVFLVIRK
jgi:drug/metabolite transporter (DMT)-like permease